VCPPHLFENIGNSCGVIGRHKNTAVPDLIPEASDRAVIRNRDRVGEPEELLLETDPRSTTTEKEVGRT